MLNLFQTQIIQLKTIWLFLKKESFKNTTHLLKDFSKKRYGFMEIYNSLNVLQRKKK